MNAFYRLAGLCLLPVIILSLFVPPVGLFLLGVLFVLLFPLWIVLLLAGSVWQVIELIFNQSSTPSQTRKV